MKRGATLLKTPRGETKSGGALLERGATLLKTPRGETKSARGEMESVGALLNRGAALMARVGALSERGATLLKTPRGETKSGGGLLARGAALLKTSRGEMASDGGIGAAARAFLAEAGCFFEKLRAGPFAAKAASRRSAGSRSGETVHWCHNQTLPGDTTIQAGLIKPVKGSAEK